MTTRGSKRCRTTSEDPVTVVRDLVAAEYRRTAAAYGRLHSAHEGYALILEELDELKEEIWKHPRRRSRSAMFKEAVQVAATTVRFVIDVCLPKSIGGSSPANMRTSPGKMRPNKEGRGQKRRAAAWGTKRLRTTHRGLARRRLARTPGA